MELATTLTSRRPQQMLQLNLFEADGGPGFNSAACHRAMPIQRLSNPITPKMHSPFPSAGGGHGSLYPPSSTPTTQGGASPPTSALTLPPATPLRSPQHRGVRDNDLSLGNHLPSIFSHPQHATPLLATGAPATNNASILSPMLNGTPSMMATPSTATRLCDVMLSPPTEPHRDVMPSPPTDVHMSRSPQQLHNLDASITQMHFNNSTTTVPTRGGVFPQQPTSNSTRGGVGHQPMGDYFSDAVGGLWHPAGRRSVVSVGYRPPSCIATTPLQHRSLLSSSHRGEDITIQQQHHPLSSPSSCRTLTTSAVIRDARETVIPAFIDQGDDLAIALERTERIVEERMLKVMSKVRDVESAMEGAVMETMNLLCLKLQVDDKAGTACQLDEGVPPTRSGSVLSIQSLRSTCTSSPEAKSARGSSSGGRCSNGFIISKQHQCRHSSSQKVTVLQRADVHCRPLPSAKMGLPVKLRTLLRRLVRYFCRWVLQWLARVRRRAAVLDDGLNHVDYQT